MAEGRACDQYASLSDFSLPASEFLESSDQSADTSQSDHYASLKIAVLSMKEIPVKPSDWLY